MRNKGITMIVLVITIAVATILAVVTYNLVVGDRSVVAKAAQAKYRNSVAEVEEWINKYYTEHYEDMDFGNDKIGDSKLGRLMSYVENSNNFKGEVNKTSWTWDDSTNNPKDTIFHCYNDSNDIWYWNDMKYQYFTINGKNLAQFIKAHNDDVDVIDDDVIGDKDFYLNKEHVYGITKDLKVYMYINGVDDRIGISDDSFDIMDEATVIFKKGSEWQSVIKNQYGDVADGDLTFDKIKSFSTLTITQDVINNKTPDFLEGIGELKSLKKLVISDIRSTDAEFFEHLGLLGSSVEFLQITNSSFPTYKGVEKYTNLQTLYLIRMNQLQFDRICDAMKNTNYSKLSRWGVFGYSGGFPDGSTGWSVTDGRYSATKTESVTYDNALKDYNKTISGSYSESDLNCKRTIVNVKKMGNLTSTTKQAIRYLFLNYNHVISIEGIEGLTNLSVFRADSNYISSVGPLNNASGLAYLMVPSNRVESLETLTNSKNLTWIDLRSNSAMKYFSNIKRLLNAGGYLYFKSPKSLAINDAGIDVFLDPRNFQSDEVKLFLNSLGSRLQIDPKYAMNMLDPSILELYLDPESCTAKDGEFGLLDIDSFLGLKSCKKLQLVSLNKIKLTGNLSKYPQYSSYDDVYQDVLGSLDDLKRFQILNNSQIKSINFAKKADSSKMNLVEMDIRQCANVKDLTPLNSNTKMTSLIIDNANIDLTTIQTTISRMGGGGTFSGGSGLLLANAELYKQLPKCTDITSLYMYRGWRDQVAADSSQTVDLTNCKKLTWFGTYSLYLHVKLPESLQTLYYAYGSGCDFSACKNLSKIQLWDNVDKSVITKLINDLPNKSSVKTYSAGGQGGTWTDLDCFANLTGLTTFEMTSWDSRPIPYTTIQPLATLKNLQTVRLTYATKLQFLPDMSNMTALKSITINNCNLMAIEHGTNLAQLPNLTTVDFASNKISNIEAFADEGFDNLSSLNLETNTLYKTSQYNSESAASYSLFDEIFLKLCKKNPRKLMTLKIAGNPNLLEDVDGLNKLRQYTWSAKSGF